MIRKFIKSTMAVVTLCGFVPENCKAQSSKNSNGTVEIIDTAGVVKLISERQKLVKQHQNSQQPIPEAEFVLVDVRSDQEIAVSIIPEAITKAQFEAEPTKYKNAVIIPYCTVGGRSENYAKQLICQGWKVKNYKGSILDWVTHELPLKTLKGESTNRVHIYSDRYNIPDKYESVTK